MRHSNVEPASLLVNANHTLVLGPLDGPSVIVVSGAVVSVGGGSSDSSSSLGSAQPWSARSTPPSPSLSWRSSHCFGGGSAVPLISTATMEYRCLPGAVSPTVLPPIAPTAGYRAA